MAANLAERAVTLPDDGLLEWAALTAWLAATAATAGVGLAIGAFVLVVAQASATTSLIGLAAGCLLAALPLALASRLRRPGD
jgi:hypothetical protein